jgi:hypothetical protein
MSEIIQSADAFLQDLQNTSFAVYVYIGGEDDKGWKVAEVVEGLLPRLRVYRAPDRSLVAPWLAGKKNRGVIFGVDDKPKRELRAKETEDLVTVLHAVKSAWEGL